MEFFGALIGLALVVYTLLGPFIMLGMSHRLRELEKKVREIEAAQRGKRGVFPGRGVTGGGRAAPEAAAVVEAREAVLPAKPGEDAVDKVPRV